ncbi:MAG: hypothetical protein ACOCYE_03220, partial [Pseudomonadota bacterium]
MNGVDVLQLANAVGALVAVLALIVVFAGLLRLIRQRAAPAGKGRLALKESLVLDARHRLVRVEDGNLDHLLVLGPGAAVLVQSRPRTAERGGDA